VGSYFAQSSQSIPSDLSVKDKNEYAIRLLEVLEIQCGEDGELYARQLRDLLGAIDQEPTPERQPVLENIVEIVLLYIKNGECVVCAKSFARLTKNLAGSTFRIGCATTLIVSVVEANLSFSSTLMVIISAMASEFSGQLSIPPVDILRGLASRLTSYTGELVYVSDIILLFITKHLFSFRTRRLFNVYVESCG
jgi:AP-4 complex subunit epsilon-1